MKLFKDQLIKGATFLGVGTLISKILGAIYRVPLTNMIGGYGMGIYQTVFPLYAILLDFSGAGAPSAISKIISSYNGVDKENYAYGYLKTAIKVFSSLGVIFTIFMSALSGEISKLQGCPQAKLSYVFLSPAIIFVCIVSCYRGYFQGLLDMMPTAFSQVFEQLIKLILGLFLARLFYPNVELSVVGTTLAITISEIVAMIYLVRVYKKRNNKLNLKFVYSNSNFKCRAKTLIKTSVPFVLLGVALPLSHLIDSFLVVNIMNDYTDKAMSLYGLMSGAVHTITNLPVAVCYGISTVTIPSVSSAQDVNEKNKRIEKSLLLTLLVSCICAVGCYFFAPFAVKILFGGLSVVERNITVGLLRFCSPCIVLLCLMQTQNSVLVAKNKIIFPVITLFIGVALKTVVSVIGLRQSSINIYGSAIGLITCYFFVCLVNLVMIIYLKVKDESKSRCVRQPAS